MDASFRRASALILFLLLCLGVGFLGSFFTAPSIPYWYAGLNKPSFTPPNWLFGPVWTLLYILMAVAAWLVWREYGFREASVAFTFFFIQLGLNFLWSIIFFGLHRVEAAFAEIVVLWLFILLTTIAFWKLRTAAGILFLPYLLWVTYASALNFAVWRLN